MILTFESPTGRRKWKIEPYSSGLCFKIYKSPIGWVDADGIVRNRNGQPIKTQWTEVGMYPTTIDRAVELVVDMMIADPDDTVTFEFHGLDMRKGMNRVFKKWLDEVKEKVMVSEPDSGEQ